MSELVGVSAFSGEVKDAKAINLADHLIKLKREHQSDFWPVIDAVVDAWKEARPNQWQSAVIEIQEARDTTYTKFGETKKKTPGLRRTLDLPYFVERAIRYLYSTEELKYDKEFYREMWKRYPMFRVSEKS